MIACGRPHSACGQVLSEELAAQERLWELTRLVTPPVCELPAPQSLPAQANVRVVVHLRALPERNLYCGQAELVELHSKLCGDDKKRQEETTEPTDAEKGRTGANDTDTAAAPVDEPTTVYGTSSYLEEKKSDGNVLRPYDAAASLCCLRSGGDSKMLRYWEKHIIPKIQVAP